VKASPINLAIFRIVFFAYLAYFTLTAFDLVWFAALPDGLRVVPKLAGWYARLPLTPLTPTVMSMWRIGLVVASLLACVGWRTRLSGSIAAVLAFVILGVPNLYGGKIDHYHHLVWFAAIMAVSPCGDAWSLDARRRRQPIPAPSTAYGMPMFFVWLLLGLVYFFPGVSKAALLPAWIAPDNLRFQLYQKWAGLGGFTPLVPIDRWPIVLTLAATMSILWELSAIGIFLHPRARRYGALAAIGFHLATWALMAIGFFSLIVCYVGLLLGEWIGGPVVSVRGWMRPTPAIVVGSVITIGVLFAGLTGLDSWPFAVYPRFNYLAGPTITRTELVPMDGEGRPIPLPTERLLTKLKDGRWSSVQQRLFWLHGEERQRFATAVLTMLSLEEPRIASAARVELRETTRSVWPQDRGKPPIADRIVLTLDPWPPRIGPSEVESHGWEKGKGETHEHAGQFKEW
jgi:vitamin K-dependent gamma-carboxylase-like protein